MHISGTTLISQILHTSDINMGILIVIPLAIVRYSSLKKALDLSAKEDGMRQVANECSKKDKDWRAKTQGHVLWEKILPDHRITVVFRNYT